MVLHVNAGGKSRPVKFGMAALHAFEKSTGKSAMKSGLKEITGEIGLFAELLKAGFEQGCRISNTPVDFKLEDVLDWMDDSQTVKECIDAFVQSTGTIRGAAVDQLEKNAEAPQEGPK